MYNICITVIHIPTGLPNPRWRWTLQWNPLTSFWASSKPWRIWRRRCHWRLTLAQYVVKLPKKWGNTPSHHPIIPSHYPRPVCNIYIYSYTYGSFLSHGSTPSHHLLIDGIFPFTKTIQRSIGDYIDSPRPQLCECCFVNPMNYIIMNI